MYAQKQEGYFMIRTKVPGGKLTPEQAEVIGECAQEYAVAPEEYGGEEQNELWGDAYVDITTRQDIQKHWIRVEDVPEMWERYDEVGLTTVQGCGDSARNVLGCPAAGLDDHECFNAQPVIDAVSEYFTGNREYANLPRKFKLTITGCKHDCAQSQINDIGLVPAKKELTASLYGFHARVGGGLSDGPRMASELDVFIEPEDAIEFCRAVAQTFKELGDRNNRGVCRMRYLVEQMGHETFEEAIRDRCTIDLPSAGDGLTEGYRGDHVGVHDQNRTASHTSVSTSSPAAWAATSSPRPLARRRSTAPRTPRFVSRRIRTSSSATSRGERRRSAGGAVCPGVSARSGAVLAGAVGCTGNEFCNYAIIETKSAPSAGRANSTTASTSPTTSKRSECTCPAVRPHAPSHRSQTSASAARRSSWTTRTAPTSSKGWTSASAARSALTTSS